MKGTDSISGKSLSGIDHLRQSVRDILTTPIGSRVMRREYGSTLFSLVDAPMNKGTVIEIYASVANALKSWEPRIEVSSISVSKVEVGSIEISLSGTYLPEGKPITMEGIIVS
jgi:phage baseplate assembly protein W